MASRYPGDKTPAQTAEEVAYIIREMPYMHVQHDWIRIRAGAGMTGCVAGWAALVNGWAPRFEADGRYWGELAHPETDGYHHTADVGADMLGLTAAEAAPLFDPDADVDDILAALDRIT